MLRLCFLMWIYFDYLKFKNKKRLIFHLFVFIDLFKIIV
jgi:hypothetical protein